MKIENISVTFISDAELKVILAKAIEVETGQKVFATAWQPGFNPSTQSQGVAVNLAPRDIELTMPTDVVLEAVNNIVPRDPTMNGNVK